jgi:formate-dependent nitrite reductase cytochrome c552 subunit
MRECIRCKVKMVTQLINKKGESKKLQLCVWADGIRSPALITTKDGILASLFEENVQVAVCPQCGEVCLFVDSTGVQSNG